MLDPRIAQELKDTQQRWLAEGKLPTPDRLRQYYATFRERFGPERLASLDGEALLEYMHDHGNRDSLVYWLEFKNDDEFPAYFGSIAGGSSLKFGVYRAAKTGEWMISGERNYPTSIPTEKAIEIARKHRDQLKRGAELLAQLPVNGTEEDYQRLQIQMDVEAPDVSRLAWGHKYFSLLFPDKLDDYHAESFQRFHLIKLLQVPPDGAGRYLCAQRYIAIARELDMHTNHLTAILNVLHGRPYKYWRIGTSLGEGKQDIWAHCRDGNFIAIGWPEVGDLSQYTDGQELFGFLKEFLANELHYHLNVASKKANEIKRFVNAAGWDVSIGDLVLASNGQTVLGIGRVTGDYEYVPGTEYPHRRPVEWLSLEAWKMPEPEGLRTTVHQLRDHLANLVEAERRIFEAKVAPPALKPGPTGPSTIRFDGIPGRIQSILERKGQVILYGPPGTGKTYWAEVAACDLAAVNVFGQPYKDLSPEQQARIRQQYVRVCSFHPSYGYEDFLEGYRPEVVNDQMTFVRRDGIFKQLCKSAQAEPERNFYLIIDEINRGDVPRIFGELLTVLEKDKRGKAVVLPLSETSFQVPRNVYLIGTMNTADRSIALLDTALRRRFGFIELMPDSTTLKDTAIEGIPLGPWLEALNQRIVEHVGRDARNLQIGHAYLLQDSNPITSFARLARVVREDIIPLLEEYCYEDYDTLEKILGPSLVKLQPPRIDHDLFDPAKQDDLVRALLETSPDITTSRQAVESDRSESDEADGDGDDENGEQ